MQLTTALLTPSMALSAHAVPFYARLHSRDSPNFRIHVTNNCGNDKSFGLFQVSPSFEMTQTGETLIIPNGQTHIVYAPFSAIGLRLSGNADWPIGDQWNPQGLVEFGYSEYAGQTGTAYDLSFMSGSDPSIGISVTPDNTACEAKSCYPNTCTLSEAWTNPDQANQGSPADTVCYEGKIDFEVVWCPSR